MRYAIVGLGKRGQARAHASAQKNINVTVASRRSPEELAPCFENAKANNQFIRILD